LQNLFEEVANLGRKTEGKRGFFVCGKKTTEISAAITASDCGRQP